MQLERLTPRQQELARLVARGMTNDEIAQAMSLTEHTVENYLQRIYDEFGLQSSARRVHLARMVWEEQKGE